MSLTGIPRSNILKSTLSSGDEGGELFLNKPATNTSLEGGVVVDVYRDKLRFFEQGGTARGYHINIPSGQPGAATLLGGLNWISAVPNSSSSSGVVNQAAHDNSHLYICYAANQWMRIGLDKNF